MSKDDFKKIRLESEEAYTEFRGGKPDGKRPLGRRKHRWEDNIKMDLKKARIELHGLD